ncbi:MAG: crossover junction endodeoxyribonuclease RuvC [Acutalibacteraceae bacterium]|nr:crossover junction endodeoxyribonuclease RuvC [Acutalibacteraceae bacterium]
MRILGIDPGYATIGYGIVEYDNFKFKTIAYGAVTTKPDKPFADRLCDIFDDITTLVQNYKPNSISIEKLFFNTNTTTAIDVAQARGVILLAARRAGVEVYEYTPLQVKQSITGYGRAEKHQVMEMVKNLLCLKSVPKPDDTADALALAICHAHSSGSLYTKLSKGELR